jgi:hypothetical protein
MIMIHIIGGTVVNAAVGVVSVGISDIIASKPMGDLVDCKETQNCCSSCRIEEGEDAEIKDVLYMFWLTITIVCTVYISNDCIFCDCRPGCGCLLNFFPSLSLRWNISEGKL